MSTTTATFNLDRFTQAITDREASPQIDAYARDAVVTIIDHLAQPGSPRVLRGRDAIAEWINDTAAREMTHAITHSVLDEHGAAFLLTCRYPDGTNVVCSTLLALDAGEIAAQTVVQAWDEQ